MFRRLLVSIEILRPHNMLVAAFSVAAGYFIAGGRAAEYVWPAALFTALVTGAGNVINDCHDVHIDRINKPRRPLPSGRLTKRHAVAMYVVATVAITAGVLLTVPLPVAAVICAWQLLLFVYARSAKRVFVLGNLLVALIASSAFLAGGLLAGDTGAAVVPFVIAFVFIVSRELVKGAEDVEGDRAEGVGTAAAVVGLDRTVVWAASLMLVLSSLIPLPTVAGHYTRAYLWVMEGAVVPGLILSSLLVLKRPEKRTFGRVSWLLKIEMFFGVLAVGLGRL
jgi:geranylgeranylglycerol-phosphate geranylgeranyltransferase